MLIQAEATRPARATAANRDRITGRTCDIWELVAPSIPCPACDDRFEDRLSRAGQLAG